MRYTSNNYLPAAVWYYWNANKARRYTAEREKREWRKRLKAVIDFFSLLPFFRLIFSSLPFTRMH
jgi:hypothetical protein